MRKNLAAVVAVAVAAALLTLPADARPRNQSAPMRSGNTKYRGKRRRWMAASPGGHARAGSKRSNTMGSGCLTVPTAIDVVGRHAGIRQELVPGPAVRRDGRGLGTMTKKPVRRYTVDGKRMTPDDLQRLHDYLVEMDSIAIISDEMRVVVESEWPELVHKLPPK